MKEKKRRKKDFQWSRAFNNSKQRHRKSIQYATDKSPILLIQINVK